MRELRDSLVLRLGGEVVEDGVQTDAGDLRYVVSG